MTRLGVYADLRYERGSGGIACDTAFVRFIAALGRSVDHLVVFGREGAIDHPMAHLGHDEAEFVALPDYRSLADVAAVARAIGPSRAAWQASLAHLDALLVFGPHPVALALVGDARRCGVPVVLGVRQDLPGYLGPRASERTRPAVVAAARLLEGRWRQLARVCPTVVTGPDLAHNYRAAARLLDLSFSLVDDDDIQRHPDWSSPPRALSVGRLDPEKNPLLLAEIAAGLRDTGGGWQLRAVGSGSLEAELASRRRCLGLEEVLDLPGAVPYGDAIRKEYLDADVLLHVSHTEGQPQVLLEAMAAGLPIVATAVGGVPGLLAQGARGLLVPPGDAAAATAALERIRTDPELRTHLVSAAHDHVRTRTITTETARLVAFVEAASSEGER